MKNNEETYLSLFEYLGKGSGGTNTGREATAEAVKQGIEIKWEYYRKKLKDQNTLKCNYIPYHS